MPGDNQPPVVHALAHAMNAALGNVGQTVVYTDPFSPYGQTADRSASRTDRRHRCRRVKMLVILGGNPVYNTPADLKLNAERMKKVPLRCISGLIRTRPRSFVTGTLHEKHYLEGWSDARAYDGTASDRSAADRAALRRARMSTRSFSFSSRRISIRRITTSLREYWQTQNISALPPRRHSGRERRRSKTAAQRIEAPAANAAAPAPASHGSIGSEYFERTAQTGISTGGTQARQRRQVRPYVRGQLAKERFTTELSRTRRRRPKRFGERVVSESAKRCRRPMAGQIEISILPDPCVYDGRFTNNGWLQELPNPLNKGHLGECRVDQPERPRATKAESRPAMTISLSGAAGARSALSTRRAAIMFSDLVTLNYQGARISKPVPMWIAPGQPDDVITIFHGLWPDDAGKVGTRYRIQRIRRPAFGRDEFRIREYHRDRRTRRRSLRRRSISIWKAATCFASGTSTNSRTRSELATDQNEDMYPKSMYPTRRRASEDVRQESQVGDDRSI